MLKFVSLTNLPTVLITGTTSGIGKSLADRYASCGRRVIAVNRRDLDITRLEAVRAFLGGLQAESRLPSLFFLNAGINKPDNFSAGFDYETYREVMEINLAGVLTFVAGARELGVRETCFVGISSVSNLVPNPGHLGYHLSKWGIRRSFELLQARDGENTYKAVVLGPVHTRIARDFGGPVGWQRKLFDWLAPDAKDAAEAIARFAEGRGTVLSYPLRARLFYQAARVGLTLVPRLYSGTERADALVEQSQ